MARLLPREAPGQWFYLHMGKGDIMMHPDLWLIYVQQRQRELWAEAAQTALVRQLHPALFARLFGRMASHAVTVNAPDDDAQTLHTAGVSGQPEHSRLAA